MKRILICFFAAALLFSASGCEASSNLYENSDYMPLNITVGPQHSDVAGVSVQVGSLQYHGGKTELAVAWNNDTDCDVMYGASYTIERLEDNKWVSCAKQEQLFFDAIGYELKAGKARNETYDLTDLFDVSLPGTYRFKTDCYVYMEVEQSQRCTLWAEFTVGNGKCSEDSKEAKGTGGTAGAEFKTPPTAVLVHSGGSAAVTTGGYSWFCTNSDGTMTAVIADQASRIPEKETLQPILVKDCQVKLEFEAAPDRLEITCWPDTVWANGSMPQETVSYQDDTFFAKLGGYVYEITAVWDDTGSGYHGTANYYVYIVADEAHIHITAEEAETVAEPLTGYCGNTQTTLYIGQKAYTFIADYSVTLTDILRNLDYRTEALCRCVSEYTVDTEFGTGYEVNLTEGFARCEAGQARLSREQVDKIRQIVEWAETTGAQYLLND